MTRKKNGMIRLLSLTSVTLLTLGLMACGTSGVAPPSTTAEVASSSVSPAPSKTATPSSETTATNGDTPAITVEETPSVGTDSSEPSAAIQPAAEEPYIVECLFGTPGPTLMSDGTTRNTEYCGNQPGAQAQRDAESAAGYDPDRNQILDGGVCPSYGQNYVTDPALCPAVPNENNQY